MTKQMTKCLSAGSKFLQARIKCQLVLLLAWDAEKSNCCQRGIIHCSLQMAGNTPACAHQFFFQNNQERTLKLNVRLVVSKVNQDPISLALLSFVMGEFILASRIYLVFLPVYFVFVPIGCYNQFGFDFVTLNKNALWCENENT